MRTRHEDTKKHSIFREKPFLRVLGPRGVLSCKCANSLILSSAKGSLTFLLCNVDTKDLKLHIFKKIDKFTYLKLPFAAPM